MSKKRTTAEANNDEQSNEDSESPTQGEDDVKRPKLDPENSTTLQDLLLELLEDILVKTVVMEVKGLKLAKSVWKEKADLAISRLRPVCSLWSGILTTNSFRTKLHRTLDSTAQTVRLEILHRSSTSCPYLALTTLKDEVFLLYRQRGGHCAINVYKHRDNMKEATDVIPLPGTIAEYMTGCNVSNCVYLCLREGDFRTRFSVLRISRDVDHKFEVSSWKTDDRQSICMMSVSANGSLIVLCSHGLRCSAAVYNADATLQREILLSRDIDVYSYESVLQKSNGNLVLSYVVDQNNQQTLLELDMNGNVVRQLQWLYGPLLKNFVNFADDDDRIMIAKDSERIELLDSEFNLLAVYSLPKEHVKSIYCIALDYDRSRNEIVRIQMDLSADTYMYVVTIFRLREE